MENEVKMISTIDELLARQKKMNKKSDLRRIRRAFDYANKMHENQVRLSGEKYIIHPLNVAYILANLGIEDDVIIAALLHDVIEDTEGTYEEIAKLFSEQVAVMVEGVTKLGKLKYTSKEETQVENYRKMFLAMGKDIRVILVKIADRLHNMQTMNYMRREKQIVKSKETLDIYAPLANRLGMRQFKSELEDLGFKYLLPEEYQKIVDGLNQRKEKREEYKKKLEKELTQVLKKSRIKFELSGRAKHVYSIYKKMTRDNITLDQVYDLFAFRILVDDIATCYSVLGVLHEKFTPMMGRFKDYVAVPKANMYQSIHTTLIKPKEAPFEVQVRTYDMHKVAEYGIAAHWAYKEANYKGKKATVKVTDDKLTWVRETIEWQEQTKDPDQFMEALKTELFEDEVYIFTPKGEIKMLPKDSITIDFAYLIHEQVGNKLVGARINGDMVPITTKLKNGDIVQIITSEGSKGPSRDWLKQVKTPMAKARIMRFFKKEQKDETIEKGKELIEKEVKRMGLNYKDVVTIEALDFLMEKYGYNKVDDLYAAVGFGTLGVQKILGKVINIYNKNHEAEELEKKLKAIEQKEKQTPKHQSNGSGIYVKGIENCLIKTAKCCSPVPGDEIVGYITQGLGISVHRSSCSNVKNLMRNPNRMIEVFWEDNATKGYMVQLEIYAVESNGILKNILSVLENSDCNLTGLDAGVNKDKIAVITVKLTIKSAEDLQKIINKLVQVDNVIEVKRKIG